jgi:hypothetical protein
MNTITIKATNAHTPDVSYNEVEVQRFIDDSRTLKEREGILLDKVYHLRRQIREFFKDQDWDRSEITINKTEVNELLEELGCDKLTTKYRGTYTITGTFNIEASDEDEAQSIISDESEVSNYGAEMSIDQIETFDIEDDE